MKRISPVRKEWWLLFAITLIAAWFAPDSNVDAVRLSDHAQRLSTDTRTTNRAEPVAAGRADANNSAPALLQIQERYIHNGDSVFAVPTWIRPKLLETPSAPAMPQLGQVSPSAPPLPFKFMGRYTEDGRPAVFLLQADLTWVAQEGEMVAGNYKVERIDSNSIQMRFLPLNVVQVLELAATP
jgi:hypothetical protein